MDARRSPRPSAARATVDAHADELGGQRIGAGPRGRLRFDLNRALAAWTSRSESGESLPSKAPAQGRISRRARSRRTDSRAELLPIRSSAADLKAEAEIS